MIKKFRGEVMIQSKKDLIRYLKMDKYALGYIKSIRVRLMKYENMR